MSKDFSNPKKLGFMRFIQAMCALNLALIIAMLGFITKNNYTMGIGDAITILNLLFDGITFWLIWQRKKATRVVVMLFSLFNIFVGSAVFIALGEQTVPEQIISVIPDIILFVYFLTSRRAKAILVHPFSVETMQTRTKKERSFYQPKTWTFWRNLIIYFCLFSVVGHWMEAGFCTLIRFGILPGTYDPNSQIWSDWLYPFLVYGFGAAACVLILYPVKTFFQKHIKNPVLPLVLSFVANALVCTLIEFTMGMLLNQPDANGVYPLWDYTNMFCNFMGQVCLQNALAFGLAATLMTWVIYPALEKLLARIPKDVMTLVFIAIVVGFAVLFFFYCINVVIPGVNDSLVDGYQVNSYEIGEGSSSGND